jgi:lipopolysaccharide/colanic/teichoic acid biosynthesis glycosyltransferase
MAFDLEMLTSKRVFDVVIAGGILTLASPLLLVAAIGIKLSSPGPVLFPSRRIAYDRRRERRNEPYHGREFVMHKFRTMRVDPTGTSAPITAWGDARVFTWGRVLRATKLDELPQLFNVMKGDMALVGPRPEAPEIVRRYYSIDDLDTLRVRPGVTSPGTLYYYTHCEGMLAGAGFMKVYTQRLLPLKLSLDRIYLKRANLLYDCRVILRTVMVIVGRAIGIRRFPEPPELREAVKSQRSDADSLLRSV